MHDAEEAHAVYGWEDVTYSIIGIGMAIADLHIHSRFAMACSESITVRSLADTALKKGIDILGTGDILHNRWLDECEEELEEIEKSGTFKLKNTTKSPIFILSAEVSTVFFDEGKTRKIHNCILLPSIDSAKNLRDSLKRYGELDSDGRPTLNMGAPSFVETLFSVEPKSFVFPAHIWTPYFGALGSISGYDSIRDAYKDQSKRIFAIETGLSSDPPMNWLVKEMDSLALISNSDMHSLMNMGREANVLKLDTNKLAYSDIIESIKGRGAKRLSSTIEFYPEEGKYHYDGHRDCHFSSDPLKNHITNCRVCGKPLVKGVLHRVADLSSRPAGYIPKDAVPYIHIIPLNELISYSLGKGKYTKTVSETYESLIKGLSTEFNVLMNADIDSISEIGGAEIGNTIRMMREGRIRITPGYAGVFGKIEAIDESEERPAGRHGQMGIGDF